LRAEARRKSPPAERREYLCQKDNPLSAPGRPGVARLLQERRKSDGKEAAGVYSPDNLQLRSAWGEKTDPRRKGALTSGTHLKEEGQRGGKGELHREVYPRTKKKR